MAAGCFLSALHEKSGYGSKTAASPPDVRRGFAPPLACLSDWALLAQTISFGSYGGAEPRLTSGGEAATEVQDDFSCEAVLIDRVC